MNRDMERHKEFSRRALILGAGKVAIFGTLAFRLAYLQVFERQKFQTLSDKNRISLRLLPAQRGEIMDRFGAPLAINKQDFRALLVPEQADDVEEILARLAKLIPISDEEKEEIMVEIDQHHPFAPVLVKEDLTWSDMSKVEINLPDLAGVSMEEGQMRSYPLGTATAHIPKVSRNGPHISHHSPGRFLDNLTTLSGSLTVKRPYLGGQPLPKSRWPAACMPTAL